ncbi:type I secretion system permease/ATPase [Celeribacter neptunius]|uniref:ATP-binding cassette, subfamily C, LapB n=1 Tax=Celeribacter neptunius TaxID=588602 RepID=A0A1I3QE66_9RHOB|nr:type I secretion system permease/ATPase [Celeribacter neptunius]SFJ31651.1 ATP-binding cassette, subfamily C, LapB [Celeribacter neptunius]
MNKHLHLAQTDNHHWSAGLLTATALYLSQFEASVDEEDLLVGLPASGGELRAEMHDRALARLGYTAHWEKKRLPRTKFPYCAEMKHDRYAVVVGSNGNGYQILDALTRSVVTIEPSEFETLYVGRICRIFPTVELLQERHSVPAMKGHWFWGRVLARKARVIDITLASLVANLIAIAVSLFTLQVYDRVIPGQSEATLWVLVGGAAIAIFFEASIRTARSRLIDETGREAELQITQDLFSKITGMRMDKLPASPGALVHMVREFGAVREFFTTATVGVVADLPFVFVFLFVIFGIAGPVVWIIVIGALLTIIPSLLAQRRMAVLSKETLGGMSSASRLMTEVTYGLETVKATRSEARFQKNWEEIVRLNAVKTTEQRVLSAFLTFWAAAVQQATYIAAVVAGAYMVFAGEFSVGSIVAVSILSTRTLAPVTQLAGVLGRWQNMKASLEALEQLMASEQERHPERTYIRQPRIKGAISVSKATFVHPGADVESISVNALNVQPGCRLALLGENGSGKSTFLKLLSGLYHTTQGEITLDGIDIRQIDPADLRRNVGFLPQEVRLFRGTLRENLTIRSAAADDEKLLTALDFGGLGEFIRRHPRGLDLEILDGGEGLSIGQRQSVGLARLFLQDPALVLLDEPTSALDQKLEQQIVQRLGAWLEGRTLVVATHRPSILSIVDRIAVMQNGQVALEDDRNTVMKQLTPKAGQSI